MDLFKIIQELRDEKRRIEKAIEAIEELTSGKALTAEVEAPPPSKKKRGRPPKHARPSSTS